MNLHKSLDIYKSLYFSPVMRMHLSCWALVKCLHNNNKLYFIYIFGSLWNVLECWLVLATDGVAHQWQHTRVTRLGNPVTAERLGVTPYIYMTLHHLFRLSSWV